MHTSIESFGGVLLTTEVVIGLREDILKSFFPSLCCDTMLKPDEIFSSPEDILLELDLIL